MAKQVQARKTQASQNQLKIKGVPFDQMKVSERHRTEKN